jgi:hypothetical protein
MSEPLRCRPQSKLQRTICVMAPLLLLAFVSACAPMEWHKTGATGSYNAERDQNECLALARTEAHQRMPLQQVAVPQIIIDQQGRAIPVNNAPQPDADRFFLEQSLLRQCMTERGYTLQRQTAAE